MSRRGWINVVVMQLVLGMQCWADITRMPLATSRPVNVSPASSRKLLCYYSLPCPGQHTPAPLPLSALQPNLCTHIVISSAVVHNTTIVPCAPEHTEVYKQVVSLKKQHPNLQVLVRVEGNWTALIQDSQAVAVFAYNAGQFLHKLSLDGVEIAWQPPAGLSWGSETAQDVSLLLLQLNNALKLASHPPFILSMAVSASQNVIDRAYDIRILNQTVDFVSVSTYDFHTYHSYLPFTGHGAPLRPQKAEHGHWATLNTEWAVRYWLRRGLPHEKLVVTIPTYANTWKLLSSAWTRVGAPADGLGMMDGRMTYSQVCVFVQEGSGWQWDEASRVPYAWRSREWVSYEDDQSVKEKAQLVMTEDLAGVAVLDLNSDDWGGLCPGTTTFPLLRAVKNVTSRSEI